MVICLGVLVSHRCCDSGFKLNGEVVSMRPLLFAALLSGCLQIFSIHGAPVCFGGGRKRASLLFWASVQNCDGGGLCLVWALRRWFGWWPKLLGLFSVGCEAAVMFGSWGGVAVV